MKKIYKIFCLIIVVISFATVSNADDTVYDRLVDIPVPDNSTGYADSTITEKQQEIEKYEQKEEKEQNMKKYCKIHEKSLDSASFAGYNKQACKRSV